MSSPETTVMYHAHCGDGFCAAWAAWRRFGQSAEYLPVMYGQPPPARAFGGGRVYILDFSYSRVITQRLCAGNLEVIILDHHKSAVEELAGLAEPNLTMTLDVTKSGGRLAWERFHSGDLTPWLVDYTEDRDFWRFALPDSREVNAAIASYPNDFARWDYWHGFAGPRVLEQLADEGDAILRYKQKLIDSAVGSAREVAVAGHRVLAANTQAMVSEVAGRLAEGRPFGAAYFDRADGKRQWSLRSAEGGLDVSEVARSLGGGGHPRAAGFEEVLPSREAASARPESSDHCQCES